MFIWVVLIVLLSILPINTTSLLAMLTSSDVRRSTVAMNARGGRLISSLSTNEVDLEPAIADPRKDHKILRSGPAR